MALVDRALASGISSQLSAQHMYMYTLYLSVLNIPRWLLPPQKGAAQGENPPAST